MLKRPARPAIRLRGVRQNNLKNFDLDLPLGRLIVITGLSGCGKSSLAFDTLFAEGQRRYIETFSPYARQFFDRMDKPQVDRIENIPPAIAIEQRNAVKTTRSTVGTMTEICDYMKAVWPQVARLHCRQCGQPVGKDSPRQIWKTVSAQAKALPPSEDGSGEVLITFDLPLSEKLSFEESLGLIQKQGYQRLLVAGEVVRLDEIGDRLTGSKPASLTVVQDRVRLAPANRARLIEACEQAYHFGKGKLAVQLEGEAGPRRFSNRFHCAACDLEYREPVPAMFSFNHPLGACPACRGFGRIITIDYDRAIPDRSRTLAEGAVKPWQTGTGAESQDDLMTFCRKRRVPTDVPFAQLPAKWQQWVIEGDPDYGKDERHQWPRAWYGVKGYFRWLESKAYKMHVRVQLSRYRAYTPCPDCGGKRFQPETLLYRFTIDDLRFTRGGESRAPSPGLSTTLSPSDGERAGVRGKSQIDLADFYQLSVAHALQFIQAVAGARPASPNDPFTAALNEVRSRLRYLLEVGLGYLTLDRPTRTLSGGETERVNLTTCLGAQLVNTLFVLDEPSVGLHPRDSARLVQILERLRDLGNTVLVVEHEAGVIRAADQIVDIGPEQGERGGEIVFQGTYPAILKSRHSLTGQYLSGRKNVEIPARRPVEIPSLGAECPRSRGQQCLNDPASADLEARSHNPPGGARDGRTPHDKCSEREGGENSSTGALTLRNATLHNVRELSLDIPLQRLVCITGVSGSGKTTLVRDVLLPRLNARLAQESSGVAATTTTEPDEDDAETVAHGSGSATLSGWEQLGRAVLVDQSALGKTPRSNPAVYTGAFDHIREVFAQSEAARQRGLNASAFSFNSSQGQCERCRGAGFEKIEMQFLSDVFIRCPECEGRRYRGHILEVKVRSQRSVVSRKKRRRRSTTDDGLPTTDYCWNIADMLEATAQEAIAFLSGLESSRIVERALASLRYLQEVGLGYLRLGQPINTLSGGECQRLKLVRHLAGFALAEARESKPTLFLFDEPTTGLHFDDVRVLLNALQKLVNAGHSVVVIEHNLELIKCADWVIDLGPEGGAAGGRLVAQGTPEAVAACAQSHTGRALREVLSSVKRTD